MKLVGRLIYRAPLSTFKLINFSTVPGSAGNLCQAEAPGST